MARGKKGQIVNLLATYTKLTLTKSTYHLPTSLPDNKRFILDTLMVGFFFSLFTFLILHIEEKESGRRRGRREKRNSHVYIEKRDRKSR